MGSFSVSRRSVVALAAAFVVAMLVGSSEGGNCGYEAIFNFGDSNSDTGGFWSAFPAQGGPYGMTYFKRPAGRATDGRLIIDFLAESLGHPYLSPYLQSIGSDYKRGANFATLASTVLQPNTSLFVSGISPFYLQVQVNQFKMFKARVDELSSKGQSNLPSSDVFGKSLYTFFIGQNDFTANLASVGIGGVKQYLPQVAWQTVSAIKEIYAVGGRTFLVQGIAPIGCYPAFLVQLPHESSDVDQYGCMSSYNNAVLEYNNMLKDALSQTRQQLKDANIVFVDTYKAMLELFQNPSSHGMKYGTTACCGAGGGNYNFNPQVSCGNSKDVNGQTVTASACGDPYNYVSWDGIHATEAANKQVADAILGGAYSEPGFKLQC